MRLIKKLLPFILIAFVVILFFFRIFRGEIPFPGDLLVNQNPYNTNSYLGYAPGGFPNKAQGPDVIYEIYPWRYFAMGELKNGEIPFWNPYNFSGNPQMANFQTAVFYPFNLLYFILPFNLSWTIIIMLQPLLAAFFMYLFLKKSLGLKDFPSFIGAISFGFCSYMTVWIEYGNIGSTLMWLPLALLLTKNFFVKSSIFNFFLLCFTLAISILAGYIQGIFYIYILAFLYFCFLFSKEKIRNYRVFLLFVISLFIPFLITAFQILPTLFIFANSTRGSYSLLQIEKNLSPIFNLITIAIPDFFGNPASRNYWIDGTYIERVMYAGSVMLFFAVFSFFSKIKLPEKKFFAITAILSLIIATNFPFIKYLYLIPIPVISTTVATRELSIFIFSIIVLGAIGLSHFMEEKKFNKKFVYTYLFFLISLWVITFIISKTNLSFALSLKISERNIVLPTFLIISTFLSYYAIKKYKTIFYIIITTLVVLDLFYFFNKITPFAKNSLIYPETPIVSKIKQIAGINRFWGYGSGYLPSDFQTVDKTFSPEGNDPLHISRYGQLLASSKNGRIPANIPRPDANIAPGFGTDDLKSNFYRKRILNLLGVKYILHKQDSIQSSNKPDFLTFPENQFKLVGTITPWQIYENLDSVPRIFITGNYVVAKDAKRALSFIYSPNIDLKNTVILEKIPSIPIKLDLKGKVQVTEYNPNKVIVRVTTSADGLLFLSDNYYPEWKAKIDGKPKEVLLADYSFRAIELPSGNHIVEFYYDPKIFQLGLLIGFLGIFTFVVVIIYLKTIEKK